VDIGGSPSVHVEVHVPRHEEDKGHARQAEPENKQERKQEGLEREIPPPFVGRRMPVSSKTLSSRV
jgi:hypothetical protein